MAKGPTKEQFKILLKEEIAAWEKRASELRGKLKEQAIGRKLECECLLDAFEGNI
ncbi:hypothetical protein ACPUYX_07550 [Desulfosporosinus sp. SYSU MS00001]|uniref:Uncharacterized protein n=1 Tax=Desulfosporosinus acididurans TaxID=476652 RepID=A0A0J1FVQ9_9FIRM|nr:MULTISPECIES: hypothetical protein [Desulfosporosinus]KLU67397.1 hypothetical protein DEAC_c06090 [Desulfosporosinus acididurans]